MEECRWGEARMDGDGESLDDDDKKEKREEPLEEKGIIGPAAFKQDYGDGEAIDGKEEKVEETSNVLMESWVPDFLNRDGRLYSKRLKGLGLVPCLQRCLEVTPDEQTWKDLHQMMWNWTPPEELLTAWRHQATQTTEEQKKGLVNETK